MDTEGHLNSMGTPLVVTIDEVGRLLKQRANELICRLIDSSGRQGPPYSIVELAALQGIKRIEKADLGKTDAVLLRQPDGYVVKVNSNHHPFRQSFSCAHEIAHILLHDIERRSTDSPEFRALDLNIGRMARERLCDEAAAELLMPAPTFRKYLSRFGASVSSFEGLSGMFKVSIPAIAIRVSQISEEPCVAILWRRRDKPRSRGFQLVWASAPGSQRTEDYRTEESGYVRDPSALLKAYQSSDVIKSFKAFGLGSHKKRCYMESKGFGRDSTRYVISLVFPERNSMGLELQEGKGNANR
jgi:Zn-dependent peptidase ImmA (M78 family)